MSLMSFDGVLIGVVNVVSNASILAGSGVYGEVPVLTRATKRQPYPVQVRSVDGSEAVLRPSTSTRVRTRIPRYL